tara:strand:- start:1156 stop:2637 length:1482 start_codon:yes stop_codon:yes gene_type:complete
LIKKLWIFPFFLSLFLLSFWFVPVGIANTKAIKASPKTLTSPLKVKLTLKEAIRLGLKFSFEVKEQKNGDQIRELKYKSKKRSLSLPQVSLYAQNTLSHSLLRSKSSDGTTGLKFPDEDTDVRSEMANEGGIGIEISEFTLFNFGKDQDLLKGEGLDLKKGQLKSKTFYMNYKFRISKEYFRLQNAFEEIASAQKEAELTKEVYELAKKKRKDGASGSVEYLFAKSAFLEAERKKKEAKRLYYKKLFLFNFILGQPLQQDYKLVSKVEFRPLKITLRELLKWIEVAPTLTEAKLNLNHSKLNLRTTWKDLMPFPKVSLSGLRYGHGYGKDGGGTVSQFIGSSSSSNFDIRIALNLSVPLVGENGFFNRFGVQSAELSVKSAENKVKMARMKAQGEVIGKYNDIMAQEEAIKDYREAFKNSSLLLDEAFKAYRQGKAQVLQMKDALNHKTSSIKEYKEAILNHLEGKMALATAIGMENPFGESDLGNEKKGGIN